MCVLLGKVKFETGGKFEFCRCECCKGSGMCLFWGKVKFEAGWKFEFVGMKLMLVIIKVKHRSMTSHIQYKFSTSTASVQI